MRLQFMKLVSAITFVSAVLCGCSERSEPTSTSQQDTAASPASPEQNDSETMRRTKLRANGIPSEYAAHYEGKQLVRIVEQRTPTDGTTFNGEYEFAGARLLRYRGAKVAAPAQLDLQFDMRGAVQSGQEPDVTDEDIAAIRGRGQLLRSHALAQRDVNAH